MALPLQAIAQPHSPPADTAAPDQPPFRPSPSHAFAPPLPAIRSLSRPSALQMTSARTPPPSPAMRALMTAWLADAAPSSSPPPQRGLFARLASLVRPTRRPRKPLAPSPPASSCDSPDCVSALCESLYSKFSPRDGLGGLPFLAVSDSPESRRLLDNLRVVKAGKRRSTAGPPAGFAKVFASIGALFLLFSPLK